MATRKKVSTTVAAKEGNLRGTNPAYVWTFIGVNVAVFLSLIMSKRFAGASIDRFWRQVTAKDGIIAASIPIVAIVLTGVLSDTTKARLVFWRWTHPLPGCRVFTTLIENDLRIDVASLEKKHGGFPRRTSSAEYAVVSNLQTTKNRTFGVGSP
jgi:hypothetical protein